MNMLARRRGIGKIQRVQFIGDGATWIQKIREHAFKNCGAIRTLDFVHAAGYLHRLLEALSAPGELAAEFIESNDEVLERGREIEGMGVKPKDALHLASAEKAS